MAQQLSDFDTDLLSRIEDASINASAPPQQRWLDGWLLRTHPGKAKRARCILALAPGRLPLSDKLAHARVAFERAGLPLLFRITPFTQPPSLDAELDALGWSVLDDTRVMACAQLHQTPRPLPAGTCWTALSPERYAQVVGELRDSPAAQRVAHAERMRWSPVPHQGFAVCSAASGEVLACGQFVREHDLVGLYDVFTRADARGQGLAGLLCERLLTSAAREGAKIAYLQVEAENLPARAVYHRLGFRDGYAYHYRLAGLASD